MNGILSVEEEIVELVASISDKTGYDKNLIYCVFMDKYQYFFETLIREESVEKFKSKWPKTIITKRKTINHESWCEIKIYNFNLLELESYEIEDLIKRLNIVNEFLGKVKEVA